MSEPSLPDDWPCDRVRRAAHDWMHDELAPDASLQVARHVARCPGCARAIERERRYHARLRRLAAAERAPAGLRARIAAAIRRPPPSNG